MSMKTHSLSALVLIAVGHIAIANENDADISSYIPKPPAGAFVVTYFDSAAITNLNGVEPAPEATQVDTYLKVPLGVSGDLTQGLWVYQFTFREREFRFDNTPSSTKQRLYDIAFPLSYIVEHDKNSRWVFNLSPGVKSSLEYFGTDDLSANAVAQYTSSNDGHGYNLGVVYTHRFGEGEFLPLVNYQYTYGQTMDLIVGFPFSRLSYAPDQQQHYFAKLTPEGGNWHVYNEGEKDQTFDFQQKGFRFGLGAEFNVAGPLWLGAEAGTQFGQELTLDNEQGQSGTLELENSSYLQFTAKLRFKR